MANPGLVNPWEMHWLESNSLQDLLTDKKNDARMFSLPGSHLLPQPQSFRKRGGQLSNVSDKNKEVRHGEKNHMLSTQYICPFL